MLDLTPRKIGLALWWLIKTITSLTLISIKASLSGLKWAIQATAKALWVSTKVLWGVLRAFWGAFMAFMYIVDDLLRKVIHLALNASKESIIRANKVAAFAAFSLFLTAFNVNTSYLQWNPYNNMPFYSDYVRLTHDQLGLVSADDKDVACLALNMYFEARSESVEGQIAVAFVTLNRVASKHHPKRICNVVYQRTKYTCQFSWVCLLTPDQQVPRNAKLWAKSQALAKSIIINQKILHDTTGNATYYKATWLKDYSKRFWGKLTSSAVIGQHEFYTDDRDTSFSSPTTILVPAEERTAGL